MARRYDLDPEVAGVPRCVVAESDHLRELEAANSLIRRHEAKLAECCRLASTDADDRPDWILAQEAVREVKRLREDYDALQKRIADLVEEL